MPSMVNKDEMISDSVGAEGSRIVARCVRGAATVGDSECGIRVCDCVEYIRSRKMWQRQIRVKKIKFNVRYQ